MHRLWVSVYILFWEKPEVSLWKVVKFVFYLVVIIVLGMVLQIMPSQGVHQALEVLLQLLKHQEWEARHGGLLGLKYLLAVREVCFKYS